MKSGIEAARIDHDVDVVFFRRRKRANKSHAACGEGEDAINGFPAALTLAARGSVK